MKNGKIYFLIAFMWSLVSCSYEYNHSYEVTNNSDSVIEFRVIPKNNTDSTFRIASNETKVVLITVHRGSKSGPNFVDVDTDLDQVMVKQDTLNSKKNYLENASWIFEDGVYRAVVVQNEFQ